MFMEGGIGKTPRDLTFQPHCELSTASLSGRLMTYLDSIVRPPLVTSRCITHPEKSTAATAENTNSDMRLDFIGRIFFRQPRSALHRKSNCGPSALLAHELLQTLPMGRSFRTRFYKRDRVMHGGAPVTARWARHEGFRASWPNCLAALPDFWRAAQFLLFMPRFFGSGPPMAGNAQKSGGCEE